MPKPANLENLIACLGDKGTLDLVAARGGTRVYVPAPNSGKNVKSLLSDILDAAMILKLSDMFGGTYIEVPLCRDWRIKQLLKQGGMSHAEIARRCGTTERTVQRLSPIDGARMPHGYNGIRASKETTITEPGLP